MLIALALIIGAIIGYFTREVREALKRIELTLKVLIARQKKEEQQEKKMTFASPMTMDEYREMEDDAKIQALNE